jgi:hypothetical protein
MLVPQRLAETSRGDGEPLDVHGKRLIDCYDQLAGILRNRLGQNHAQFLAQPRAQASGAIQWYTPLAGNVVRADALPPEERQRLQDRAQRILGDIQGVASDIESEGAAGQMIGAMLRAASHLAPQAPLFSVDGKPVVILWGHRSSAPVSAEATTPNVTPVATPSKTVPLQPQAHTSTAPAVPANSGAEAIASKIPVTDDAHARKRQRNRIIAACAALIAVAAIAFGLRHFWLREGDSDASAGDLDTMIAQTEERNRVLEADIARMKGKGPAVKCVPEAKK